ncbi:MAG: nucleoside triphosphate pyrophosphohydrolase family protein [Candidatus Cloacimonetes bacterium]|nr:nucleoside triphosphate pyrophosphohydrolase family protein [Candidatus Cloacimonadota bacterium]
MTDTDTDTYTPSIYTFDEYQTATLSTAVYRESLFTPDARINYTIMGLIGEAGELANKWKKYYRGDLTIDEVWQALNDELGDVLWYIARLARELDINLSMVAIDNIAKLADRKARGVIRGSGDNR